MSLTWPSAFVLSVVVVTFGALTWRGMLDNHIVVGVGSACAAGILGYGVGLRNGKGAP